VPEPRAVSLVGGRVLDLRPAISGDELRPERATTVAIARPTNALNITAMRRAAHDSGFPDAEILDHLEWGLLNGTTTPKKTRVAAGHRGAFANQQHITDELEEQVACGWIQGPFRWPPFWPLRCVEKNVVEQLKPGGRIKLRTTTDYSESGSADSINAGIDLGQHPAHKMCRALEASHAAAIFVALEALLQQHGYDGDDFKAFGWMSDLRGFYRQLSVATQQLWMACFLWNGEYYVDQRVVFGDSSAVHLSTRIANFLVWVLRWRIKQADDADPGPLPEVLRVVLEARARRLNVPGEGFFFDESSRSFSAQYIDDMNGHALGKRRAQRDCDILFALLKEVGLEAAAEKLVPPTRRDDFLGTTFDLDARTVSLSETFWAKLAQRTEKLLASEDGRYEYRDLEKVVYSHNHVAVFLPLLKPDAAKTFAFFMKAKAARPRLPKLTPEFRELCAKFVAARTAEAVLPLVPVLTFPQRGHRLRIDIETDASGEIGWGFVCLPSPHDKDAPVFYAAGRWTARQRPAHINEKELWTTLVAAVLLSGHFPGAFVLEAIDNTAAKDTASANKSQSPAMRAVLRRRADQHRAAGWTTHLQYIRSAANDLADALSRDDFDKFFDSARKRGIARDRLQRLYPDPATKTDLDALLAPSAP